MIFFLGMDALVKFAPERVLEWNPTAINDVYNMKDYHLEIIQTVVLDFSIYRKVKHQQL